MNTTLTPNNPTPAETSSPVSFTVGKSYVMRSPCNHACVWHCKVTSRSRTMIELLVTTDDGKFPETKRVKVRVVDGVETCQPLGRYSMSPTLAADREVKK